MSTTDIYTRIATTIRKYVRDATDETTRNRLLLKEIRSRGNIEYNCSGEELQWQIEVERNQVQRGKRAGQAKIDVNIGLQRFKKAVIDYIDFVVAEGMSKRERLSNRGKEALIDYWAGKGKRATKDITEFFSHEFYADSTTGPDICDGLQTFMKATQTIDSTQPTTVARTANSADEFAYISSTYAGLSTALGTFGGSWNGRWPDGSGQPQFDAWTPVGVNYTSTAFGGDTWSANSVEAMRRCKLAIERNGESPDVVIMTSKMYGELLNRVDAKERVLVETSQRAKSFGIKDQEFIRQDGMKIMWEFGVPENVFYMLNLDRCKILSQQGDLFHSDGPEWSNLDSTFAWSLDFIGQIKWESLRYFGVGLALA